MMPGSAAAMQSFNATTAAAERSGGISHHHAQVPSQYHVTLPAHQPPVRHSHSVVDNAYASVPGMPDIFYFRINTTVLFISTSVAIFRMNLH